MIWSLLKYYKVIIIGIIGFTGAIYYNYASSKIDNLNDQLRITQKQLKVANYNYQDLIKNDKIKDQIIESVNYQNNILQQRYENDRIEIAKNSKEIDRDNIITKQWLRYAFGFKSVPSSSATSKTITDQNESTGLVNPSITANRISQYTESCQQLKINNDALIDFYNLTTNINDSNDQ